MKKKGLPTDPIVLVIDIQSFFLNEYLFVKNPRNSGTLVINQINFLRECIKEKYPVIFIEYSDRGPTIPQLTDLFENNSNCEKIIKTHDGGFSNTELEERMQKLEKNHLVLTGIQTALCVYYTGKEACDKGYYISTSADLTADSNFEKGTKAWDKKWKWFKKNGLFVTQNYPALLENLSSLKPQEIK